MPKQQKKVRKAKKDPPTGCRVMTIGHGTRSAGELIEILKTFGVSRVVDVRKMPRSRTNPQFNYETLPSTLAASDIGYTHMPGLTGLRKQAKSTTNAAWRNKSFRAYADYMQTPEFASNIDALIVMAKDQLLALMCAETLPWRCHRSLVGDALIARGVAVQDIMSASKAQTHALPDFAKLDGERVYYPADPNEQTSAS